MKTNILPIVAFLAALAAVAAALVSAAAAATAFTAAGLLAAMVADYGRRCAPHKPKAPVIAFAPPARGSLRKAA